jgi:hypothetical protein
VKGIACHFGADMRLDLRFIRGEVETRGAVNAIGIEERHGRHIEVSAYADQFLGQGRAFEKTESRAGVKFDEHKKPGVRG